MEQLANEPTPKNRSYRAICHEAAAYIKSVGQDNHFIEVRQLGIIKLTFGIKDFFITHRQDKYVVHTKLTKGSLFEIEWCQVILKN